MIFNSVPFLIFYLIVLTFFYTLPGKLKWFFLIAAGAFFYMYFIPSYILLLLLLIVIDFNTALLMGKSKNTKRKVFLLVSICSNLGLLFIFKYFDFLNLNLNQLAKIIHWNYPLETLKLIIPLGLSFHTFQSISYIVDVYKRKWKAEKNFFKYCLYVMFFPQMVAGPIERPSNLLPQLFQKVKTDPENLYLGFQRILFGLLKKIVIADNLAILVNKVYLDPQSYIGFPLILATIAFAVQIYCDFSGYSDIAIGIARTLGIKLDENFKSPYFASSISNFWRRWHITLYNWFRDYVYIPLGGNKLGQPRHYLNILIVFTLSGLWHGAAWTYIIWGLIHGIYLVTENILGKFIKIKLPGLIKIALTFSLVNIAWIFFRAKNLTDALYIITHLQSGFGSLLIHIKNFDLTAVKNYLLYQNGNLGLTNTSIAALMLIITILFIFEKKSNSFFNFPRPLRWAINVAICLTILNFSIGIKEPFIYFQF